MSIKTAEKKPRFGVVECSVSEPLLTWIFVFHSALDVRCSMFDVHPSKQPLTAHFSGKPSRRSRSAGRGTFEPYRRRSACITKQKQT